MVASNAEALLRRETEGKALLRMKPLDREAYVAWSDAARETVGGCVGSGSPRFRELLAARRKISVTFETDPSYYLTQLGANLRRELAILRKLVEEIGEPVLEPLPLPLPPPAAAPSPVTASRPPPPSDPAGPKAAASRTSRLVVFAASDGKAAATVVEALRARRAERLSTADDLESLRSCVAGGSCDACALVVLGAVEGTGAERPVPSEYVLGFLVGLLGPARVCIVHDEGVPTPAAGAAVRRVCLQDPDGWRPAVLAAFRGAGLVP